MNENLQKSIVKIATPYSVGVGFFLPELNYIVTTINVVRENREVIIKNKYLSSQLVRVRALDGQHGLAFLDVPSDWQAISLHYGIELPQLGDKVASLGMPSIKDCSYCAGQVIEEEYIENDITFISHNCPISYDCIGGPLIDISERVLGLNMHVINDASGITKVFALPIGVILEIAKDFEQYGFEGVRCEHCQQINGKRNLGNQTCSKCRAKLEFPSDILPYEPIGVAATIEAIIDKSGRDVRLTRRGPNVWEIIQGSAKVDISYYDKEGLIMGDAYLCLLPDNNKDEIFQYLLKQNSLIEGLSFSIKGEEIVLSLIIYDGHLNADTGFELLQYLLTQADHYDNILVEEFGAKWKYELTS